MQVTPIFSFIAYTGSQLAQITSAGADAIYYTTDGSTPTTGSTLYSGLVSVTPSTVIKAIAVKTGYSNSAVGSATYASPAWTRTANLLIHPENLTLSPWSFPGATNSTIAYGVTDPIGGSTASHLVCGSTGPDIGLTQETAVPKSTEYTVSVVTKVDGTGGWLFLGLSDYIANAFGSSFNINTGALGLPSVVGTCTFVAANITSLGSGWYLCSVTGTSATSGGLTYGIDIHAVAANGVTVGIAGNGLDIWHPQINQGSSVATYGQALATPAFLDFSFIGTDSSDFQVPAAVSTGPNIFCVAGSNDGVTWTGGSGTCDMQVKAPQALVYNNQFYYHIAQANDENLLTTLWYVCTADVNGKVTIASTINWSSKISGLASVFAGEWFVEANGTVHLFIPCSNSGVNQFSIYESHALDSTLLTWSDPILVSATGGDATYHYDPKVFLIGSTYYMWLDNITTFRIELFSSSSLLGPYTNVLAGNWAGWGADLEGFTMFPHGSGWRVLIETIKDRDTPNHTLYYADCSSPTAIATAGNWSGLTKCTVDKLYRHGSVIAT